MRDNFVGRIVGLLTPYGPDGATRTVWVRITDRYSLLSNPPKPRLAGTNIHTGERISAIVPASIHTIMPETY